MCGCGCGCQSLVGCVGVKGLWCVLVSKACSVGVWVSKACRVCECRRLVGCVWVSKACRVCVGVEGL